MSRFILPAVFLAFTTAPAIAGPLGGPHYEMNAPRLVAPQLVPVQTPRYAAAPRREMGGGFIEFLFNGTGEAPRQVRPSYQVPQYIDPRAGRAEPEPAIAARGSVMGYPQGASAEPARPAMDPRFLPQSVAYGGNHASGTIVIDTPSKFLYLVEGNGRALRYGIGVGRDGFTWSGTQTITKKAEWPDWHPPMEMIERQPYLPRFMAGGPGNPLGARAMYLGSTVYRIHGTNRPDTIGTAVSSGCFRLMNDDVIDLYGRVKIGAKVIVMR